MKTTRMLFLAGIAVLFSTQAKALERYEFYNGTRQMGMGGVAVATVNDETALILNPAALGKLRNNYLTVLDPEVDNSATLQGIIKKGGSSTSFLDPQKMIDQLLLSPDKHLHVLGQVFPSFVTTNFGIGIHGKYRYDGEYDLDDSLFRYHYLNDVALIMGFNFRIWDGRIKFGFSGRLTNRVEANYEADDVAFPSTITGLKLKDIVKEGVGIGGDVGLILTAPWAWLPSISGVLRDAGGTSYNLNDGFLFDAQQRPDMTRQTVDAGLSISPILGNRMRLQIAGEYRDVLNAYKETDNIRKVHAGLELNFADMIFLRGGMNQRYWTAGMEFTMHMFQFQAASYGEEIGTKEKTREDRRYMGKFAFRF